MIHASDDYLLKHTVDVAAAVSRQTVVLCDKQKFLGIDLVNITKRLYYYALYCLEQNLVFEFIHVEVLGNFRKNLGLNRRKIVAHEGSYFLSHFA